ncbi:hypothetical protein Clacol_000218 [Clathrus columnatus]|uniref:Uncharacterized protein n=1 Tax=Clathrus columnatus TaxID=1419009 RepID=A0AAV4ZWB2_9AGAM|nr:hypothetical protein Clacol_000218 [Clathrus columnatus]
MHGKDRYFSLDPLDDVIWEERLFIPRFLSRAHRGFFGILFLSAIGRNSWEEWMRRESEGTMSENHCRFGFLVVQALSEVPVMIASLALWIAIRFHAYSQ